MLQATTPRLLDKTQAALPVMCTLQLDKIPDNTKTHIRMSLETQGIMRDKIPIRHTPVIGILVNSARNFWSTTKPVLAPIKLRHQLQLKQHLRAIIWPPMAAVSITQNIAYTNELMFVSQITRIQLSAIIYAAAMTYLETDYQFRGSFRSPQKTQRTAKFSFSRFIFFFHRRPQ